MHTDYELRQQAERITKDMVKARGNKHEFARLERRLDEVRQERHEVAGVKEVHQSIEESE